MIIDLAVLEGEDIDDTLQVAEDFVPFIFMFGNRCRLVALHDLVGLYAMDVRRDHRGQVAGHFLGMLSYLGVDLGHVLGPAADLLREIPALE